MAELVPSSLPTGDPRELDLLGGIKGIISVLRRGWRLIGISALICLTVAIIFLARTKRIYQAEVRLLVLQQGGRPLNVANTDPSRLMEGTANEDYIPTHILIISSPQVVQRAIDKIGLDSLPSLLAAKKRGLDPVKEAINHLKVTRPDRLAKVLRVEYRAGGRDEVVRTIEAITASYRQFIEETLQRNSSTAIAIISKAHDDLSREPRGAGGEVPGIAPQDPGADHRRGAPLVPGRSIGQLGPGGQRGDGQGRPAQGRAGTGPPADPRRDRVVGGRPRHP